MRATFTQRFNQEQKLEQEISKVWGYAVSPSHLECSKASKVQQKAVIINRAIKPLIMDKRKPMMSTQHQLLIKQIAQIEHQKKMRKKAEEKNESQFNVSKLMNDRVREYNYLIDHKHIKEKNSEDTKRVLKLKPKSEAEQIVDQIKQKNKQLILTEDINKQLKINKSIAILYRKYKQKMYEEHGENEEKRLHSTLVTNASNKNTNPRIRTKSMASQGRVRNYSECLSKLKVKGQSQENQMKVENAEESINIQQQFMNEEEIKKNNEFQRKIQNNKQFLDMYKFKIKTLKNFNKPKDKSARKPFSNKAKMAKQQEYRQRIENSLFSGMERDTRTPHLDEHLISELRQKRKDQIKYFSSFLEKRNRKFKKPWGNKILIKFDSNSQAKQMLEGTSSSISPNKTQYFTTTNNSQLQHQTNKSSSFYSMPKNMGEEDRQIFESMREDQEDPRLYETMCKNEKVNLFLKAAKRNKF